MKEQDAKEKSLERYAAHAAEQVEQEQRATRYDRMSSKELMTMYNENRSEWELVMEAKRAQGTRQLMRWR